MPRDVGVIVVAAGQGNRVGGQVAKQYREIAGVPMLLRALRPFTSHPEVLQVVVALPKEDAANPPPWLATLAGKTLTIVAGGPERTASVRLGLAALKADCRVALVHDAARPFANRQIIDRVIAAARDGVGAVPAVPVSDTLKQSVSGTHRIANTVARDGLWQAQTPQGFPRDLLDRAHSEAASHGISGSDDAALVERLGIEVRLVPGSVGNLKVTTAEDLLLAERIASTSEE